MLSPMTTMTAMAATAANDPGGIILRSVWVNAPLNEKPARQRGSGIPAEIIFKLARTLNIIIFCARPCPITVRILKPLPQRS
jgi:hypothetical protein